MEIHVRPDSSFHIHTSAIISKILEELSKQLGPNVRLINVPNQEPSLIPSLLMTY